MHQWREILNEEKSVLGWFQAQRLLVVRLGDQGHLKMTIWHGHVREGMSFENTDGEIGNWA